VPTPMFLRLLLRCAVSFAGLFLIGTSQWSNMTFGDVSFEQFVYHLRFGANGLLQTDRHTVHRFIVSALELPLLAAASVAVLSVIAERRTAIVGGGTGEWTGALLDRGRAIGRRLHLLAVVGGLIFFLVTFSFGTYVASFFGPDVFAANYLPPSQVTLTPTGKPKSLVIIYVESLESTYQDRTRFGRDLIAPLTRLQHRYASFDSYPQVSGAHWTIAGIVATQCGVPLKVSLLPSPEDARLHLRSYLPRATCLGDLLRARGYENVFMNGPDLDFADLGTFLKDHGYSRRYGAREWIQAGEDPRKMKEWGLRDDRLLAHARTELTQLVEAGRPFNLTILTVDTHGPDGLLSDTCRLRGVHDFPGIVTCTADQVAEFVNFIADKGWLDRISVMVQGDHIAMENPLHDTLETSPKRTVFNLIATEPSETRLTDGITHFDMFPTLLELAGFRAEGGKIGLGYCMLKRCGTPPPPPERIQAFKDGLLNRSPVYETLWTG
jgi:phosphoglycerol transferase